MYLPTYIDNHLHNSYVYFLYKKTPLFGRTKLSNRNMYCIICIFLAYIVPDHFGEYDNDKHDC